MDQLKKVGGSKWVDFLLLIALIAVAAILTIWLHGILHDYVMAKCPGGTFLSGENFEEWTGWTLSAVSACLAFGAFALIDRIKPRSEYYRQTLQLPWQHLGWSIFSFIFAFSLLAASFASTAQFCLTPTGIYSRVLLSGLFSSENWKDVTSIKVDCHGGKSGPLFYVLTMRDGKSLDIADAFPNDKGLTAFDRQLVGTHFAFQSNVESGCPSYFVDWVGQRP